MQLEEIAKLWEIMASLDEGEEETAHAIEANYRWQSWRQ